MKLKKIVFIFFLTMCFFLPLQVDAKNKVTLYFFHGDGCPHCEEEHKLLKSLEKKYDNLKIVEYEVWNNKSNSILLEKVKRQMDIKTNGVPITIIGSVSITGYSDTLAKKIERAIIYHGNNKHQDIVKGIRNGKKNITVDDSFEKLEQKTDQETTFSMPFVGEVNAKNLSMPAVAAAIGLVDGFNPCAMWVLLFLISMLIGMKNRKRMWILGISFLGASALVYMFIMLSWLQIAVTATTSIIFRNMIAIVALIGATLNFRSFLKSKESGCEVVDDKKRKKMFSRIKKFTQEKNLLLALLGVIVLAVTVNIVELACSAGLPVIFTQILAINNITGIQAFYYTLIYILFFLFDDILIFSIAMFSMKITGISTKYNKYSHIIGAIFMLVVGILLLFKPEWLMFNFK